MKYLTLKACFVAVLVSTTPVLAQTTPPTPSDNAAQANPVDREAFVDKAQSSNHWEIRSSALAETQAQAEEVKEYARMIIKDHEAAGVKLADALQKDGSNGASEPAVGLMPEHEKMLEQLKMVNGADFDKMYLDMQEQAHVEAVDLFRSYAKSGEDEALTNFASETLPTLETHLEKVKKLDSSN